MPCGTGGFSDRLLRLTSPTRAGHMRKGLRIAQTRGQRPGGSMTRIVALALLAFSAVVPASAQDWPAKTVRLVVPFGAGATPDTIARLIADRLQHKLGQSF